jgi:hypothetical protein
MARKSKGRTSTCLRNDGTLKASFGQQGRAARHALYLEKVHRTGRRITAYRCEECGRWHVGKARSRKKSGGWA